MKKSVWYSVIILIIANLFPLIGIIFLGWNSKSVLILFWLETGIIGFFWVIKMLFVNCYNKNHISMFLLNFLLAFAIVFIWIDVWNILIKILGYESEVSYSSLHNFINNPIILQIRFGIFIVFLSHSISFFINFILNKEYQKNLMIFDEILGFFNRFTAISYTLAAGLIFGIFYYVISKELIIETQSSVLFAIALILIKGYFDLKAHIKEHSIKEKEKWMDSNTLLKELRKSKK